MTLAPAQQRGAASRRAHRARLTVDAPCRASLLAAIQAALRLLSRFLFKTRGLNKVHAQTGSFNKAAQALLKKAGFKLDGTLRHHYFYDGEYHDGLVYSLLAYEFEA